MLSIIPYYVDLVKKIEFQEFFTDVNIAIASKELQDLDLLLIGIGGGHAVQYCLHGKKMYSHNINI